MQQQNPIGTAALDGFNTTASGIKVNLSYCRFSFQIRNRGLDPIEEYKLFFEFEGDVLDLQKSNEEHYGLPLLTAFNYKTNVYLWPESKSGKVIPKENILVSDDTFTSDDIFIMPLDDKHEIIVNWKQISKDFMDEGKLKIIVIPDFETRYEYIFVEDPLKIGTKESEKIEEVIIEKPSE